MPNRIRMLNRAVRERRATAVLSCGIALRGVSACVYRVGNKHFFWQESCDGSGGGWEVHERADEIDGETFEYMRGAVDEYYYDDAQRIEVLLALRAPFGIPDARGNECN